MFNVELEPDWQNYCFEIKIFDIINIFSKSARIQEDPVVPLVGRPWVLSLISLAKFCLPVYLGQVVLLMSK